VAVVSSPVTEKKVTSSIQWTSSQVSGVMTTLMTLSGTHP
jgi:hypothetical protein